MQPTPRRPALHLLPAAGESSARIWVDSSTAESYPQLSTRVTAILVASSEGCGFEGGKCGPRHVRTFRIPA